MLKFKKMSHTNDTRGLDDQSPGKKRALNGEAIPGLVEEKENNGDGEMDQDRGPVKGGVATAEGF